MLGVDAETGLVLLDRLIDRRLDVTIPHDATRRLKIRAVLAALALRARPAISLSLMEAVEALGVMWADARVAARFTKEPAEVLLDEARATGVVDAEGDNLAFVHPLVATFLSAEGVVAQSEIPARIDPELAAFVAALLPEDRHEELLDLLARYDICTLARALRLRPSASRTISLEDDAVMYLETLERLRHLAPGDASVGISYLASDRWFVVKSTEELGARFTEDTFDDWSATTAGNELTFVVWPGVPFAAEPPAFVAAAEILYRFKRDADMKLKMPPDYSPDREIEALLGDHKELAARALEFFGRWRDAITDLAVEIGLSKSESLSLPHGEPSVKLHRHGGGAWLLHYAWGSAPSFAVSVDQPPYPAVDVATILRDPKIEAAQWLRTEVERSVGSALNSASWLRPELLAGWVW
jgi:hypothetical protein